MPEGFASVGLLPHIWILPAVCGFFAAIATIGWIMWFRDEFSAWDIPAVLTTIVAAFALVGSVISLIPFDGKYHHFYHVRGEVASVSNVLTEASGDLTKQPVVQLSGSDVSYQVEDPRVVNLKGEDVTFLCSIEFVYYGADRYNCVIAEVH